MNDLNMKPILSNSYNIEKMQPKYSTFTIQKDHEILPIFVNESGADILRMCNGQNTTFDIINSLLEKYNDEFNGVKGFVTEFLDDMYKNKTISFDNDPAKIQNMKFGSKEYWTPDEMGVELTNASPLKRKNCIVNAVKAENGKYIDEDVFYNILFDMKSMHIENLNILGGEPLLHDNFFGFLSKATELGIMCNIYTSGYIYSDEVVKSFANLPNNNRLVIQINVDGLEERHDYLKGVKGAFKNTMSFIDAMVKLSIPVEVTYCVNDQTYLEIETLTELLKDKGVRSLRITPIANMGAITQEEIASGEEDNKRISEITSMLRLEFQDESFKIIKNLEDKYKDNTGLTNCGLGQTELKIDPYGKVYPCSMSNIVIGNICEESIKTIQMRSSKLFEKLTQPTSGVCGSKPDCMGCIMKSLTLAANSTVKSEWYDEQIKIINQIKVINGLNVNVAAETKSEDYYNYSKRDLESIKKLIFKRYAKKIKEVI